MLMYCEVFIVLFLWRSQHENLWKDYRKYTLKDILSDTKDYFSQVLLLLSKFCEFLFGVESPTFWPCHAPSFPPSSGSTPKPSSLCFWGTVEPVGYPQLSGAGVTALGSATQWGGVIWNALFSYIVFYILFKFFTLVFLHFMFFVIIASDFWLCTQRTPQGANLILLFNLKAK